MNGTRVDLNLTDQGAKRLGKKESLLYYHQQIREKPKSAVATATALMPPNHEQTANQKEDSPTGDHGNEILQGIMELLCSNPGLLLKLKGLGDGSGSWGSKHDRVS